MIADWETKYIIRMGPCLIRERSWCAAKIVQIRVYKKQEWRESRRTYIKKCFILQFVAWFYYVLQCNLHGMRAWDLGQWQVFHDRLWETLVVHDCTGLVAVNLFAIKSALVTVRGEILQDISPTASDIRCDLYHTIWDISSYIMFLSPSS